jgi:hypothetical protein
MVSVNRGARARRRTARSASRPQLPLRRHRTAGRIRSPSPLRVESASDRSQTPVSAATPPSRTAARQRSWYVSISASPISSRKSAG